MGSDSVALGAFLDDLDDTKRIVQQTSKPIHDFTVGAYETFVDPNLPIATEADGRHLALLMARGDGNVALLDGKGVTPPTDDHAVV